MLFLKNSHTNNLISPVFAFIQQTSSARRRGRKKKNHYAHSRGTAARREMVFNSLWNIQQWLHCTFKSLLIVKPTGNGPSCVLKSSFPTISLFIQVWTFCVNFSTCYGHCGRLQGYNLSETLYTLVFFQDSAQKSCAGASRVEGETREREANGTGYLGEEEENPPDPSTVTAKGNPFSTQALQIARVYPCPQVTNVGEEENPSGDPEIIGDSGSFRCSISEVFVCLWFVGKQACIVLSWQDRDTSHWEGGDSEEWM